MPSVMKTCDSINERNNKSSDKIHRNSVISKILGISKILRNSDVCCNYDLIGNFRLPIFWMDEKEIKQNNEWSATVPSGFMDNEIL